MTIQESSKHPNISIEIVSAHNLLLAFIEECKNSLSIKIDINNLIAELTPIIESDTSDSVKENLLNSLEVLYRKYKDDCLVSLKVDWSRLSGLPVSAATTEAGWRRALDIKYKKRVDLDLVLSLPGTPVANLTYQIIELLSINFNEFNSRLGTKYTSDDRLFNFEDIVAFLNKRGISNSRDFAYIIIGIESRKHINLVWHQANKLQKVYPQKSAAELLAYGWFGLRAALAKYDPSLGFAFSTYACTRITGSIRDGVRAESPIPKRLTTFARKVEAAEAYLTQQLGQTPTLREISAYLGDESEKLSIMPRLATQASIEEMLDYSSENGGFPEFLAENSDPAQAVIDAFTKDALEKALKLLPNEEEEAVRLLVIEGVNPARAKILTGVNSRQMRARKDKGLALLKEYLGPWDPTIE